MFEVPHDFLRVIQDVAVFGLVLSMWLVLILLWSMKKKKRSDRMQERLKTADSGLDRAEGKVLRLFHDGKEATTVVPGSRHNRGLLGRLEIIRIQANFRTQVSAILINLAAGMLLAAGVGYAITSSPVIAIAAPVAVLVVFWIYLKQRIAKATSKFERQFIDALELAVRSLRVGHPLVGSFRLISEEIPAPIGELFAQVCQQQDLGVPMENALQAVARSTVSEDMALFSTSVIIQIRSGGNLADMMQRLAAIIRERQRLARRVRVLTTQTQFSKRVLLAMPFLVFVTLSLLNPRYMQPLYTTSTGEIISIVSGIILLLGWIMMNWLSKLEY